MSITHRTVQPTIPPPKIEMMDLLCRFDVHRGEVERQSKANESTVLLGDFNAHLGNDAGL